MRRGEKASSISFRDVMLALNAVLAAVILFALPQINPPAKPTIDTVRPAGQIAVTACWKKAPLDIDLWGRAPGEDKPVGYNNRSGKVLSLLRDNRGETGGNSPANCESMFARETPAGEYVFNIFGFSASEPVSVHIEIGIGATADTMHVLVNTDMIVANRQERTVIRFKVDGNGEVVPGSIHQVAKPLFTASEETVR